MKKDNWKLETLFHFDKVLWKLNNDTPSMVIVKNRDGQDVSLPAGHTLNTNPDAYSVVLPNSRTYRHSDKGIVSDVEFSDNFNTITGHLIRRLKEGQIIGGLDFLDYHYAWTKRKKDFLTFVKHYIMSFSWTSTETREKNKIFVDAIADWIEEKKKSRKKRIYIIVVSAPVVVFSLGMIWLTEYREIFIGALIGGLAASLKEFYELVSD